MNNDAIVIILLGVSMILLAIKMYFIDERTKILGILIANLLDIAENADKSGNKGNENRCVCCGDEIPEGRQVCPKCEKG